MTFNYLRSALKAAWWRQRHRNFLIVFNWHQVTPKFDPQYHFEGTWTHLDAFAGEVDYLANEYSIVPLHEAIEKLRDGTLRGGCVSLTFDDGDTSMADHVVPLLRQRGLPAMFFINLSDSDEAPPIWPLVLSYLLRQTDGTNRPTGFTVELEEKARQLRRTTDPKFYNEVRRAVEGLAPLPPSARPKLVTMDWLKSLDGEQFALGAHGREHQRFSMMSAEWQRKNLADNVRFLSQFQAFRPIFAVPFGRPWDWTPETIKIAHDQKLSVVLADGGVNVTSGDYYYRIPSDARSTRSLVRSAMIEN